MMTAFVYDLIYTVPMCIAAVILTGALTGSDIDGTVMIFTVISGSLCVMFGHFKTRGKLLITGICAALLAGAWFVDKGDNIGEYLRVIWIIPVSIVCFALHTAACRYKKIKIVMALLCTVLLIILMITHYAVSKMTFCMIFFCLTAFVLEAIQESWKKDGDTAVKNHIVYTLPFLVVLFIPPALIRIPDKPYDWAFVKNLIENVRDGYEIILQSLSPEEGWDSSGDMGFSERASIGGGIKGNPYKALIVSSDVSNDYRLYLEGKSFDTFDGRNWTKQDESDMDCRSLDTVGTIAAIMQNDPENADDYIRPVRLRIKYEGVRTKCAFAPAKSTNDVTAELEQKGGDLKLKRGRKADYYIRYYRINRDDPAFVSMMKNKVKPDETAWNRALEKTKDVIKYPCTFEEYDIYRENIYKYYMEPVQLSERAEEFTRELLSGAGSDYEKLDRIEKYLEGFRYSAVPGELPDTVRSPGDYIDYFLFDKQEGYCIHFATAFVLLARSQNIPARYVQGYSTLSRVNGFEVRSDRAHAWPEAYIDGVGWIGFEPTPGYRQTAGWDRSGSGKATDSGTYYKDYIDDHSDDAEGSEMLPDTDQEEEKGIRVSFRSVIILLVFGAGFVLLFFVIDNTYRRYRYRRMGARDRIGYLCMKNMRMLKRAGFRPGAAETLQEFGERLKTSSVPADIMQFIGIYEQLLYASEESYEPDVPGMEKCSDDCAAFVWKQISARIFKKSQKN